MPNNSAILQSSQNYRLWCIASKVLILQNLEFKKYIWITIYLYDKFRHCDLITFGSSNKQFLWPATSHLSQVANNNQQFIVVVIGSTWAKHCIPQRQQGLSSSCDSKAIILSCPTWQPFLTENSTFLPLYQESLRTGKSPITGQHYQILLQVSYH